MKPFQIWRLALQAACAMLAASFLNGSVRAQTYGTNSVIVQTFAGSGFSGHLDGQGTQTMFINPWQIVADSSGNLYVLEAASPFGSGGGYTGVRKVTPEATVTSFAGGGTGSLPGYGTNVSLGPVSWVGPLTIDHSNTLWTTWVNYGTLLRIGSDAYASMMGLNVYSIISGLCMDSRNNLYISLANQVYVHRAEDVWDVFAGSGNRGSVDGNGIFTSFSNPACLATDAADNIYVWDSGNGLIRRINQNRDVIRVAGKIGVASDSDGFGTNASFSSISAMCMDDSGSLILACGTSIRKMSLDGNVTTIAGSFTQSGYTNGSGPLARFSGANGVCVSSGVIFVADSGNQRIRSLTYVPAPVIVAPPQPQVSCLGQIATFQVMASGDQPLSCQWWSQAGPLAGETNTNLILTNPKTSALETRKGHPGKFLAFSVMKSPIPLPEARPNAPGCLQGRDFASESHRTPSFSL